MAISPGIGAGRIAMRLYRRESNRRRGGAGHRRVYPLSSSPHQGEDIPAPRQEKHCAALGTAHAPGASPRVATHPAEVASSIQPGGCRRVCGSELLLCRLRGDCDRVVREIEVGRPKIVLGKVLVDRVLRSVRDRFEVEDAININVAL
jgi:hypothetical protein